jgi:hypothetical protein
MGRGEAPNITGPSRKLMWFAANITGPPVGTFSRPLTDVR